MLEVTVAVKVTSWPDTDALTDEVTAIDVSAFTTGWTFWLIEAML